MRGEDVKHISRVLRLRAGDAVELCDGAGRECDATVASIAPDAVTFETQAWRPAKSEPNTKVTLFSPLGVVTLAAYFSGDWAQSFSGFS